MNAKKNLIVMAAVLFLGVTTLRAAGPLSLKITGGPGLLSSWGDLRTWAEGRSGYFGWLGGLAGNTITDGSSSRLLRSEFGFEAELGLTERISLALGVGWTGGADWVSDWAVTHAYGGTLGSDTQSSSRTVTVSAVPVTLSGIYTVPMGTLSLRLMAGAGAYFGRVKMEAGQNYSWPASPGLSNFVYDESYRMTSSPVGFGIHLGVGAEIPISSTLRLTGDVLYRMAGLGEVTGDAAWTGNTTWTGGSQSASGTDAGQTLWLGNYSWSGATFQDAVLGASKPDWMTGADSLKVGLSGFVFRLGLKLAI